MNKPEYTHDKHEWVAYALTLEDNISALKAELAQQADNKQSTQSPPVCPDDCPHMHNGFCGVDCEPIED